MNAQVQAEVARRKARGFSPTTVAGMKAALAEIGYKIDRSMDCHSMNRYVSGEFAGQSYPAVNTGVVEADSGLSFAHVDARRDTNFKTLQRMRFNEELYVVVRGRILEI
jgi:hypothetical protein